MFPKNCWYVAAWSSEITGESLVSRRLLDTAVMLYRKESGEPAALEDKCCHRFAPLSHGRREGDCVRCMYHGLLFDAGGICVDVPGQEKIGASLKVRSYPVEERDGFIWIWMGDAQRAEPQLVHDAHWQTEPGWHTKAGGYIHYDANYQLIVDNLLDFSHLAYVHGQSIGSGSFAHRKPVVERGDNQLMVSHWLPEIPTPPFLRTLSQLPALVDRSNVYTWHVKGNFFAQDTVVSPANSGGRDSTRPEMVRLRTIIALTPETATTTHYFWSTTHNDFASPEAEVTRVLADSVEKAFVEDRVIIDAQQKVINDVGEEGMIPIPADNALFQVRGMVLKLLEAERAAPSLHSAAA
ncbi:MAG: Rieske 2Fe-2S domain-containing protein [Janthinobacterium lividum]